MAGRTGEAAAAVIVHDPAAPVSEPWSFSAAARKLDAGATKGEESLGPEPERHREAWAAYDEIGEVSQMVSGSASLLSQCRLYVGFVDDAGNEVALIGEDGTVAEGFDAQLAADAVATLARYTDEGGSQRGLLQRQAENFDVTGDSYLVGWPVDENGKPWEGPEDRAAGERWEVVSRGALSKSAGRWTIQLGQGQAVELPKDTAIVYRMWRKHPRRPDDSRGWVVAALDVCRDLKVFTLAQRSAARSSIPAKVLVAAQEASPRNLTPPGAPAGGQVPPSAPAAAGLSLPPFPSPAAGPPGAGEPPQAPMTWAQQLERLIGDAVMEVMRDSQSGRAVVPPVLSIAEKYVDRWHELDLSRPVDAILKDLVDQARERLAEAADNPPEMLRGLGETNRWNGAQIADDEYRRYFRPKAMAIADAWTVELLWGGLLALGHRLEDVRRLRVLVDARGVVAEPDRSKLAIEVFRLGGLSYPALRKACGFGESDAPTPEEQALILAAFGRGAAPGQAPVDPQGGGVSDVNTGVAAVSASALAELARAAARPTAATEEPIEATGTEAAPAQLQARTPQLGKLRTRSSASIAQPLVGPALAAQLTIIETTARTRLEEAAEAAFDQALARGGAKLKTWARKDHDLRGLLAAVDACAVPDTLGPDRCRRVASSQFADDDQRREDMFAAALAALLLSFERIATGAYEKALRALGVSVLAGAAGSADTADGPTMSPDAIAVNVAAGAAVLRESMLMLADQRIFSPAKPATVGELTNLRVPSPVIRRALAAAGGSPVEPGLGPVEAATQGLVFGPQLSTYSPERLGWEWIYGDEARQRPYEPHLQLDGQVFTGPDDPALSGIAPDGGQGYPGDHDGCQCDWQAVFRETGDDE